MKWLDKENFFVKSHGLGNDYIVLDSSNITFALTVEKIRTICDVRYGIGSDGILLKIPSDSCDFGLKIYNPDGSEAEKSGNGLRIYSKYLYDYGLAGGGVFTIETAGGPVRSEVVEEKEEKALNIKVDMGKAEFSSPEVLEQDLRVDNRTFKINSVSMGNPHCVVIRDRLVESEVRRYGPLLEHHFYFPNRTNVQFARLAGKNRIEILIWERGAGYTEASGSSACAAAAVMKKLGKCNGSVTVHMPGGSLQIDVDENWNTVMTGPVREIAAGYLSEEMF